MTMTGSALTGTNSVVTINSAFSDGTYINFGGGGRGIGVFNGGPLFMSWNGDYNTTTNNYVYVVTNTTASFVQLDSTGGSLQYAPTGTAGNAITTSNALAWTTAGVVSTPNSNLLVRSVYYPTVTIWATTSTATTIANTTAETSLISSATSVGTLTIPANTTITGTTLRFKLATFMQFNGATDIITIRLAVDGTTLQPFSFQPGVATSPHGDLEFEAQIQTGGIIQTKGHMLVGAPGPSTPYNIIINSSSSGGFATNVNHTWNVTAQWNNASANNNIQCTISTLELMMVH